MPLRSLPISCALALVTLAACSESGNSTNPAGTTDSATAGAGGSTSGGGGSGASGNAEASSVGGSTSTGTSAGAGGEPGAVTTGQTSAGGTGEPADDRLFVPDLQFEKIEGGGNYVNLIAFTLLERLTGTELYAAVRNDGDDSACDANITFEFYDQNDQSLLSWIGTLYSPKIYRRSDDPNSLLTCLDPGDTAMVGATELLDSLDVDGLGIVTYRFSYFSKDVLPELTLVESLTVKELQTYQTVSGSGFTGTLENGLDVGLSSPSVTVFPLNGVGRPLGMATASEMLEVLPGESWMFQTSPVNDTGVEQLAYPRGSIVVP